MIRKSNVSIPFEGYERPRPGPKTITIDRTFEDDRPPGEYLTSDDIMAAALLSASYYWGPGAKDWRGNEWRFNFVQAMRKGLAYEYRPFRLGEVETLFDYPSRTVRVVFHVAGDKLAMAYRRELYRRQRIYITPPEWRRIHGQLLGIIREAAENARRKLMPAEGILHGRGFTAPAGYGL
jgi:hypothetical protein